MNRPNEGIAHRRVPERANPQKLPSGPPAAAPAPQHQERLSSMLTTGEIRHWRGGPSQPAFARQLRHYGRRWTSRRAGDGGDPLPGGVFQSRQAFRRNFNKPHTPGFKTMQMLMVALSRSSYGSDIPPMLLERFALHEDFPLPKQPDGHASKGTPVRGGSKQGENLSIIVFSRSQVLR